MAGTPSLDALIGQYSAAFGQARAANEQRYQSILGGYTARYTRAMQMLKGMGDTEKQDIQYRGQQAEAKGKQSLISRGLYNTTVMDATQRGVQQDTTRELGALNERLRSQRIGLDTGLSADTLGFMERRNDTYPDMGQLAQLAEGFGARQAAEKAMASAGGGGFVGGGGKSAANGGGGGGMGPSPQGVVTGLGGPGAVYQPAMGNPISQSYGGDTSLASLAGTGGLAGLAGDYAQQYGPQQMAGGGGAYGDAPGGAEPPSAPNPESLPGQQAEPSMLASAAPAAAAAPASSGPSEGMTLTAWNAAQGKGPMHGSDDYVFKGGSWGSA